MPQPDCCSTTKQVDPAWEEGQRVERPAVRALVPALGRFVRVIWEEIDLILEQLQQSPEADVLAKLAALPWLQARETLITPWEVVAARAFGRSARNSDVEKISADEARRLAVLFGREHALELAEVMTLGSEEGVRAAIQLALEDNVDPRTLARRIRQSVGLTARDARALENLRRRLEELDTDPRRVQLETDRWAGRARRRRAETIARTEVNRARNEGTLAGWRQQQDQGLIGTGAMKVWIANPGCRICVTIAAQGPVPLREPFRHPVTGEALQAPPAHPNCRCSPSLIFPGG